MTGHRPRPTSNGMKILLTGGGSAGHFYPLIAIAEELNRIFDEEKLVRAELYYMSTDPYDKKILFDNDIVFKRVFAGKRRLYFSLMNIVDFVKVAVGIIKALWTIFFLFPDVVVSKGGYVSVPVVFAARIFRIPIIIHESDSVPGRANMWASRFAEKIAVSWQEATPFFPKEKTAVTGQPVRKEIRHIVSHGAHEYLHLESGIPVIFILGGSQGSALINEAVLGVLPEIVKKYQIIHHTGSRHLKEIERTAKVILEKSEHPDRYKTFGFLTTLAMKMAAGAATLVVSRAGGTIFEIAAWGVPSIIIPITDSNGDHQRKNAFNYSRAGAGVVIEEQNVTPHILLGEIDRLMANETLRKQMGERARAFFRADAAEKVARAAITIALKHEQ